MFRVSDSTVNECTPLFAPTFDFVPLRDVQDEINIRVVVVVRATPDLYHVVGQLDVLRVRLQIFGRDHDDEFDGLFSRSEVFVGPPPDRPDAFDSCKRKEM